MSADNDDVDLQLSLGYSSNCSRTKWKENSGAGVNAGPIVDMTFAASDSLSELVWSPHDGLSLKCAECSLADKKPFLLWNVGPSNVVTSPSQGIRGNGIEDEKKIEETFIISPAAFHLDSEIAQGVSLTQSPGNSTRQLVGSILGQDIERRDELEEGKTERGILVKLGSENADHLGEGEKEIRDQCNEQMADTAEKSEKNTDAVGFNIGMPITEALSGNHNKEIANDFNPLVCKAVNSGQILEEVITAAEVHMEILSKTHVTPVQKSVCLDEPEKEVKVEIAEEIKNKVKTHGSMVPIVEELEHTAENDLKYPFTKDAYLQNEERLLRGYSFPLEKSPGNGSSHPYLMKGKEKAISDGEISGRFSDDVEDSQESVESCNSAILHGKRRRNFDQWLIGDSKRLKKQKVGCPASTSIIRHGSSFMSWISNMVNGFTKSRKEEVPSLSLTLAHSNSEHTSILHETIKCRENQESVSRNMGFQTIFRSIYCPNAKLIETGISRDDCSVSRLQDLVQADKTNVQSSSISSSVQNGASLGHIFMANGKILPTSTEVFVGQSDKARKFPAIPPIQNDCRTDNADDKAPRYQNSFKDSNGPNSYDSLGNHEISAAENYNPKVASDDRATHDLSNKKNMFGSLWITRFSTKKSRTSLKLNHSKHNCQAINCPGDSTRLNENSGDLGQDLNTFSVNTECPLDIKEIDDHNYPNSVLKLDSIVPSQGFKSPEAIACVFSKRLDALKHIIPSEARKDATCTEPSCFFCGKSGHNLQDCSKIMDSELEYLLRNMSSYDWPQDSPFFCIRCFQLDHWAVMCPLMISNRQQQFKNKMSFINCSKAGNRKLCSRNERNACFLDKEDHLHVGACSRAEPFMNTDLRNPSSKAAEFSDQINSSSNETQKKISTDSEKNKFKEQQNLPLSDLIGFQIAEVPKGMFPAVRRLRVSRADILKLVNSDVSLSQFEGFFLRLRLGKREGGLGGSGYCVGCITVDQAGEPVKDSKTCISVSIGGNKCLVGSQYISNHDFLEDELMDWWSKTLKSGEKIPSTEDLETKFEQRIKLGF